MTCDYKLTYSMLQKEAVRIAYSLGLEPDYHNTEAFKFSYEPIPHLHILEYKNYKVKFTFEDLSMSIDDFAEKIIIPFLKAILKSNIT